MQKLRPALVAALAAHLVASAPARANQYEIFIDISTEEDLYDLQVADQISDQTFQTLLELYQRGVDLNSASREVLYTLPNLTYAEVDALLSYRESVGRIAEPAALVANGILDRRKLASIAPFLIVGAGEGGLGVSGWARAQTRWSNNDGKALPAALQLRAQSGGDLRVGSALLLNQRRLRDVVFDKTRGALSARDPAPRPSLPKLYALWRGDALSVVVGTYRVGFGQRLTFDSTDIITPDGFYGDAEIFRDTQLGRRCRESAGELDASPCTGAAGDIYVTPDFRTRDSQLGGAAAVEVGDIKAQAFASYQPRSIYQYELYNAALCDDPKRDSDPLCAAPAVYVRRPDLLEATSQWSFHTLPNVFAEATAGANLSYRPERRTQVGITGYGSRIDWLVEGAELDFQEWSRFPYGGGFGAVGVDAAHGIGNTDFFAEVARSFDSMPDGGGGFGALFRSVTSWDQSEVEGSLRYYAPEFANPHAGPIAAADELDGLRARDEIGARLKYSGVVKERLNLRTNLDLWYSESEDVAKILSYVRGDLDASERVRVGLWAQVQDFDLGDRQLSVCTEGSFFSDDEPRCFGRELDLIARLRLSPSRSYWLDLQYQHEFVDESLGSDERRQDANAVAILTGKLAERVRARVRSRYRFEDIADNARLEQSLWTYAELTLGLGDRDSLRFRYDLVVYLDDRLRTATREPSPESWLWLEYESRF